MNAVFQTTELLELILSFLPTKNLLLSQRVCTKWQADIAKSKPLQQALFFTPREEVSIRIAWMEFQDGRDDSVPVEPDVIEITIWPG